MKLAISIPIICSAWFAILICSASVFAQRSDFERPPIDYLTAEVHDPVSRLADSIRTGETKLTFDERFGYLQSVLEALDISANSQSLVFSKTSLQLHRISPRHPRSLFFNDDIYVGYCQNGDVLEFAATDPHQGAIFYTLQQTESDSPVLERDRGACLSCHASSRTQNVPGYLVRSVFADAAGQPLFGNGTFNTDHTSDFKDRWGGWYVTGRHGSMRHMGNTICDEDDETFDRETGANRIDLDHAIRTEIFLTPHSDIVALMVLGHQTQMHNAIAAANYETRRAIFQSNQMNELLDRPKGHVSESAQRRIDAAAERVLTYLLFCDEFHLTDPVSGLNRFADDFTAQGKRDSQGRSLRDFDLQTRLFKYPCSYLIHSPAFTALPDRVRNRVLVRLHEVLDGRDSSDQFAHLTIQTRKEIAEILSETMPEFQR